MGEIFAVRLLLGQSIYTERTPRGTKRLQSTPERWIVRCLSRILPASSQTKSSYCFHWHSCTMDDLRSERTTAAVLGAMSIFAVIPSCGKVKQPTLTGCMIWYVVEVTSGCRDLSCIHRHERVVFDRPTKEARQSWAWSGKSVPNRTLQSTTLHSPAHVRAGPDSMHGCCHSLL
jgi:hypothetical protein